MMVWFSVLFSIGIWRITLCPSILRAFNPWEAISYLIREKQKAFMQIGKNEIEKEFKIVYLACY